MFGVVGVAHPQPRPAQRHRRTPPVGGRRGGQPVRDGRDHGRPRRRRTDGRGSLLTRGGDRRQRRVAARPPSGLVPASALVPRRPPSVASMETVPVGHRREPRTDLREHRVRRGAADRQYRRDLGDEPALPSGGRVGDRVGSPTPGSSSSILLAGSVLSLVVRFHRAGGVERQQIKWVAFAMLVMFLTLLTSELFIPSDALLLDAIVSGAAFFLLPLSIGLAVLRYRLYDLDVVVRKTVVYALLAVFASAVYLGDRGRCRRLARPRELVPHDARRRDRRRDVPARARPCDALREPSRLRQAREPVRGARRNSPNASAMPTPTRTCCRAWLASSGRASAPNVPTSGSRSTDELRDVAAWPADADGRAPIALAERIGTADRGDRSRLSGGAGR